MEIPNNPFAGNEQFDPEAKLLYGLIVAGKNADFANKALLAFIDHIKDEVLAQTNRAIPSLYDRLSILSPATIRQCLERARTGNYAKLSKAIADILRLKPNLETCGPDELEKIHGCGPKTSRFVVCWIRPQERYAILDVHILRWMANLGIPVPPSTPQKKRMYRGIEQQFMAEADKRGLTPRQLDKQIWEAGAGRTQKTPPPEPLEA